MSLPKYKYLLTYRYGEIIQDGTFQFCRLYIDWKSRTKDQMEQAARSGKQCIVEGVEQSETSKKGEIKLLGVAKASFSELLTDYEDYLRLHKLVIFPKTHPKVLEFRQVGYRLSNLRNLSHLGDLKEKLILPKDPQDATNLLLTLCHMETFLLSRQIESLENRFVKVGGFTEKLYNSRINFRRFP